MNETDKDAEFQRLMAIVCQDEALKLKVFKYIKRLIAQKEKEDDSLMTKEEFFAKVDRARQQVREGKVTTWMPGETIEEMLRRKGYDIRH